MSINVLCQEHKHINYPLEMRMIFTAPTPSSTIERSPHLRAPPLLQELQLPLPRRRDLVRPGVTKKACDSTKHLPRVSTGIMCHLKRR